MSDFKNKVIYQIYPKSFKDTTGNGIGDLQGITSKLDYLQFLGVDMIWMNPIFLSPGNDGGYDITDYYKIDPLYGNEMDLDLLIKEARKRNIGIMFDMVFNHTSTTHEWFQQALTGNQKYMDYYFFKEGQLGLPTNWQSKFGGSCWEYVEKLDKYYLHLFDKTQADLNWENLEVRKELANIINYWMSKGITGFRFDVINLISKNSFENDYEGIGKRFYTDGNKVEEYLRELSAASYGRDSSIITVGEMSATSINNCAKYTNPLNHELNMSFNFHHLKVDYKNKEKWTIMDFDFKELKQLFHEWQVGMQEKNGWNALFWNCHDQPRSISRFGDDKNYPYHSATMLATAIHFQRGTPFIYQGEEIGMTNNYFEDINDYRDIESINFYQILKEEGVKEEEILAILKAKSRDNARSPMQWNDSKTSGFSDNTSWLKVNANYKDINVENAIKNQDSIFHYYRELIQLRKNYKIISEGNYTPILDNHESIYGYRRILGNESLIVYTNFFETKCTIMIEKGYSILLSNYKRNNLGQTIVLEPYEALVLYKK